MNSPARGMAVARTSACLLRKIQLFSILENQTRIPFLLQSNSKYLENLLQYS